MDPQLEEYRRKQRQRAAAEANKSGTVVPGGMKKSLPMVAVILAAAVLVAVVRTQSTTITTVPEAGTCPTPTGMGICVEECSGHGDCDQGMMCCSNGCGHVCMAPELPGAAKATDSAKCTLMVTLTDKEDAKDKALETLPSKAREGMTHDHLKSLKILILNYAPGHSKDCCAAEQALQGQSDAVKFVEYDGPKPSCASQSSTPTAPEEPMLAEVEQNWED